MRNISFLLICLFFCAGVSAQVDLKKLDAYYEKALKEWGVPGMSIAIVKDGKVIFSRGYGVREVGKTERPDENTLYAIASNSKAFTTAAIGQLVDEGKLDWNEKVKKYLPYFELYDPWVSAETTVRDVLSHRVGLKTFSGDLIWYRSNLSPEQIIRRVKFLPKSYDFRADYGYSNVMFITAGEVMRSVTGKSWGETITERFLRPLGMDRTIYTSKDLDTKGNYATPHAFSDGKHQPVPWEDWQHVAATGGIISSVGDMAKWMIFNLDNGIWKGDTLLSAASRNMIWTPHTSFTIDHTRGKKPNNFFAYGLGWFLSDYRGKSMMFHTGGYTGMLSAVALIPEERLGIVVLTNGMRGIYTAMVNYTIDTFLKAPQKDWSADMLKAANSHKDDRVDQRRNSRVPGTNPTLAYTEVVGEYRADAYGTIRVSGDPEALKITFEHSPDLSATLTHWHYDVWEIKWDKASELPFFGFGTLKFNSDNNGRVTGISFDVPNDDFWFDELNARKIE